jgi:hypothetical protein
MNPISVWVKSNLLKVKLIALGTIITALVGFHYYDRYTYSQEHVKEAVGALNASYTIAIAKQVTASQKKEEEIRAQSKIEQDKRDEKLKALDVKLNNVLSELHNRPSRSGPQTDSQTSGTNKACTGSELYREDGEFLAREAARADSIVIQRDYYYQEYENARKKLDEASK